MTVEDRLKFKVILTSCINILEKNYAIQQGQCESEKYSATEIEIGTMN